LLLSQKHKQAKSQIKEYEDDENLPPIDQASLGWVRR